MAKIERIAKTDFILEKMAQAGIDSQKELAISAGVSKDTMSTLLARRNTSPDTFRKLAAALKIADYQQLFDTVHVRVDSDHVSPELSSHSDGISDRLVTDLIDGLLVVLHSTQVEVNHVNDYVATLAQLIRSVLHKDLGWIDVMKYISSSVKTEGDRLINNTTAGQLGWLKVVFSEIPRTGRPRLIPIDVDDKAWLGSGAAFFSGGIDYVDQFTTRLLPGDYGLSLEEAESVKLQYIEWERNHHFASLVAIAIPNRSNEKEPIGVLNLNFPRVAPFGTGKTLQPDLVTRIHSILKPHLLVLADTLARFRM
jgi:hypothetical protein